MNNTATRRFFVTAISTDSGKSLISAILVEALKADYWKPVQAGRPTDSDYMRDHVDPERIIHPESYLLETPMSPHAAADIDGVEIQLGNIVPPLTENHLIIEGAGGLMVPLHDQVLISDLIKRLDVPVILVSNNYLGSINHTLLSISFLKTLGLPIEGIIFNGEPTPTTENYILEYTGIKCIARIPKLDKVNRESIKQEALKIDLKNLL